MARPQHRPRRRRKKSWLGRSLFWFACVVAMIVVVLAIAAPWVLRAAVPDAFARLGLQATVTGGGLSMVRREITLENFVLGATDAPALSLGELGLGINVRALLQGKVKLRHLRVRDVDMDIERLLALHAQLDSGGESQRGGVPIELEELDLEDIRLTSVGERLGHDVRIIRLHVSDPSALAAQRPSSVRLKGSIGDGDIDLQAEVDIDPGKLEVEGTYRLKDLPLRGWVRLVSEDDDPISAGSANGRGELRSEFTFEADKLELVLNGWLSVAGLGMNTGTLSTDGGDADWRGRIALGWSPDTSRPELRGDGSLEVAKTGLGFGRSSGESVNALIDDVSWHGRFHFLEGLTAEGAVLGTGVEVIDASSAKPAWRIHAQDFSWRLHASTGTRHRAYGVRMHDFDLAHLSVELNGTGAPIAVSAEKLAVDELDSPRSDTVLLGRASVDALTVNRADGTGSGAASVGINGVVASGLSGDTAGTLHVTKLSAESMNYADADRQLRVEEIDFSGVGLDPSARADADDLSIESAHLDEGRQDIWLSNLRAKSLHGDVDGRFGAEAAVITRAFQSGSDRVSWELTELRLRGVDGDADDAASISRIDLQGLKVGIDDASLNTAGLHGEAVTVTMKGDVGARRVRIASLEHRQSRFGRLHVTDVDASGVRSRDGRADLDDIAVASLECRLDDGIEIAVRSLEAHALGGDLEHGLAVERLSFSGAESRHLHGTRLKASALQTYGLSISGSGDVAIDKARLEGTSVIASDATVDLEGLDVTSLGWTPGGRLSVGEAALRAVHLARPDELRWAFSEIDGNKIVWDGDARVDADRLTLASLAQIRDGTRDWLARSLMVGDLELKLPEDVSVATLAADSIGGNTGSLDWNVASIDVEGLSSTRRAGQRVHRLRSGAIQVTDENNGAVLTIEHTRLQAAELSVLKELAARRAVAGKLRLGSKHADWPSRLSIAEVRIDEPLLRIGGIVDVAEVVAHNPYLIVGHSADNRWMWPPLPGVGDDSGVDSRGGTTGGIRVGRFTTRGPGRVVLLDRGTDPVFQSALDPLVVAVQNLDTTLPGNRSRFRVRGTSSRFAGVGVHGDLVKGVQGFDVSLEAEVTGAYLPELNPYVARHEPIAFTTGWGDAHAKLTIENNQLSGRIDVLLSGLQVRRTIGGTKMPGLTPGNLTIRTALALLKDGKGNVSLSVPLEANVEDPGYDFIALLQSAFVDTIRRTGRVAASVTERTVDAAVSLIESTVSVLPGVDTKRYPPIRFPPGSDDITARHLAYLNQLADRMHKYESLELALCGRSVDGDRGHVTEKVSSFDRQFAEASEGVYRIYGADRQGMVALAEARADTVRRYLRNLRKVPNSRLAPCHADYDAAPDAIPRVALEVRSPAERRGLFGLFP